MLQFLNSRSDSTKFIYVGDCGVDLIDKKIRPGGCALNVSYHLHSLKQNIDVLTWIGNDDRFGIVVKKLSEIGVNKDGVHQASGKTRTQFVSIQPGGEKKV